MFRDFEISSVAHAKLVEYMLLHLNIVSQSRYNLNTLFLDDKYFTTAGTLKCESLKNQSDSIFSISKIKQ